MSVTEALAAASAFKPQEALTLLNSARQKYGDDPQLLFAMGNAFKALAMHEAALELYKQVSVARPGDYTVRNNAAECLKHLHRYAEARAEIETALTYHAKVSELWATRGGIDAAEGKLAESEAAFRRALALSPTQPEILANLAEVLTDLERFDEAIALQEQAFKAAPQPLIAFNLSHNLFKTGNLARAWDLYEKRFERAETAATFQKHAALAPRWTGEKTSGALLVWMEQGVGEEILYASLLPEAAMRVGELRVECDARLAPLFARSFPNIRFIPRADTPDASCQGVVFQVPAASLGGIFRGGWDAFPKAPAPYLKADPARASALKARYGKGRPVIGLSWRSKPRHFGDYKTSNLSDWAEVLKKTDATFLNLQYGDTEKERKEMASKGFALLHDAEIDPLKSLDDFAAQVSACDHIITISNTTAHMAGALGVPADVLVPAGKDAPHHWFHRQDHSPWYPRLRLYWQKQRGDWHDALHSIAARRP